MALKFPAFITDIFKALDPELPKDLATMDQHLDFIIPKVIKNGQDLREEKFWMGKRWKEMREDEGFHEAILHIYNPGGEYLLSLDGNVIKGSWKKLENYNTLLLEISGKSELFDLRFLNDDFMVLSKHGDQARKGQRKYFCLMHEPATKAKGKDLDWRNAMEKMFNIVRTDSVDLSYWIIFLIIVAIFIYFSFI